MSNSPILTVENLNLVFNVDILKSWTARDLFIRFIKDPFDAFGAEKDRLQVAKNINLEIKAGERVGILGVNGAGKTSLCRCIAGMYRPTTGKVSVNGKVRAIFNTAVGIHPELTGRENAELFAQLLYYDEKDINGLINESLEFSELGRFLDIPFKLYSNGMQARLCLSLISARPADLLILDEVFDGADAFFKVKIAERVTNMIKNSGAVLFVSHAPDQIQQLCTRAIVLHHGQIAFDGPTEEAQKFYESLTPNTSEKNEFSS